MSNITLENLPKNYLGTKSIVNFDELKKNILIDFLYSIFAPSLSEQKYSKDEIISYIEDYISSFDNSRLINIK